MSGAATVALWLAIGGYTLSLACLVAASPREPGRIQVAGLLAAALAWAGHGAALLARWVASGHAPCTGPYEGALLGAWFVVTVAVLVVWRYRPAVRAVPFVLGAALLILARGLVARTGPAPLTPMYRSNWLVLHVLASWLTFGGYLMATALAALHLRLVRGVAPGGIRPAVVDELSAKLVAFGFVCHTAMLASGALWAHGLWGRYWGWDPLETWTLVSWLVYAVYLHLRFTLGWRGARASWLAVGSVAGIVVTFYGIGIVSYVHSRLL